MPIRNVLVTGANGHLARFVVDRLRDRYRLTLTSASSPRAPIHGLPFVQADVRNLSDVEKCVAGQDAVVHLAAVLNNRMELPPEAFADTMVKGTWHIAGACVRHGVRRVVHISSILACGRPNDTSKPYRAGEPSHFDKKDLLYPLAKQLAEQVLDAYRDAHGLDVIHLRPGVIAGDPRYPPPKPPAPLEDGQRWFRHVSPLDVAQAVEAAIESECKHGCFHLVAGRADAMFDWQTAVTELGYRPMHNWPEIPVNEKGALHAD